jgi:hypothetical protein
MRMGMRRFTRLTNAFSRKVDNLYAAVSLHFSTTTSRGPLVAEKPVPTDLVDGSWRGRSRLESRGDRRAAGRRRVSGDLTGQEVTQMAKVSPFHTNSVEEPPEHREVHHDRDDCLDGKRIKT